MHMNGLCFMLRGMVLKCLIHLPCSIGWMFTVETWELLCLTLIPPMYFSISSTKCLQNFSTALGTIAAILSYSPKRQLGTIKAKVLILFPRQSYFLMVWIMKR